ncbi:DUF4232 domain-containing protein [Spiractinospora alimapuensis]|nr:DUF4232 domain-containing protein [Spiractinospora alimapuensis]
MELAFLKISDGASCQMAGYANMHWVDGPDGEMVGDWASHEGGSSEPFVLDPGDWAQATVAQPHAENFPPEECDPREVPGMSVIVDDDAEGERAYVPTGGRDVACANPEVGQPRLTNVTPGGA